jgi:chemotaxis protein CheY-P-specific phosphatase CheC
MKSEREELLNEVFCDVFEKLAFMFGEATPKEDMPRDAGEFIEVRMEFSGYTQGFLEMVVPSEMCEEIAANVLGMDPEDDLVRERALDALKEMLNVTCGHILTSTEGEEPVFDLTVPTVRELDGAAWTAFLDDPETLSFMVDDSPAALKFTMEERIT